MKENALDIFVEDPLKELSEEVIQKMPQFDTFDEFAERMLPITRFNAKHRTLLKAVFSFLDHGVYCMSASRASPGPLTTQPITATLMDFL